MARGSPACTPKLCSTEVCVEHTRPQSFQGSRAFCRRSFRTGLERWDNVAMDRRDGHLSHAAGSVRPEGEQAGRKFSAETWALAEAEYFAGATAREVSAKYGMAMHTLYMRARAGGKR